MRRYIITPSYLDPPHALLSSILLFQCLYHTRHTPHATRHTLAASSFLTCQLLLATIAMLSVWMWSTLLVPAKSCHPTSSTTVATIVHICNEYQVEWNWNVHGGLFQSRTQKTRNQHRLGAQQNGCGEGGREGGREGGHAGSKPTPTTAMTEPKSAKRGSEKGELCQQQLQYVLFLNLCSLLHHTLQVIEEYRAIFNPFDRPKQRGGRGTIICERRLLLTVITAM